MSGVKHTPGPLTVRVSDRWPYDIETVNADGQVVFSDRMPAHSTAMRSHDDLWEGVGFPAREREKIVEVNRRAVADATIHAAAPDLLEALEQAREDILGLLRGRGCEAEGSDEDWVGHIDDTIARARGEQSQSEKEVGND